MRLLHLNDGWEFRLRDTGPGYYRPHHPGDRWREAAVPGHVHLDLVRHGIIADPFVGQADAGCQWVDEADWSYRTTFQWNPSAELPIRKLIFDGLDTVCKIYLNGELIGEHDNMFVPLEIDVSERLTSGENLLQIDFESAVRVGDERRTAYFKKESLPHNTTFFDERAFVRKAQCMSGWDWGPRLVSCGIWREVRLVEYAFRLVDLQVFQERLSDGRWRVRTDTLTEGCGPFWTRFEDDEEAEGNLDIILDDPVLWQPNGYGKPHLYTVTARTDGGQSITKRIGLRTVELRREPDEFGESFAFVVNGREVWARGANWIPNDAFPSRITDRDYRDQIARCRDLNMNMLRVWGGGLYESEAFYDACDECGILVWQDFPFACSYYPDDAEAQQALKAEASCHIRRLCNRACLALWCGNNENEWMWQTRWGDADKIPPRYYGKALYEDLLPALLNELAPGQAYIPTSPTGQNPANPEGTVNDGSHGDQHYWDAWHGRGDWKYYGESNARFSSEFGFASSCSSLAWQLAGVDPANALPTDPAVRWHDRTNKPWETFKGFVELHYPEAKSLQNWVLYSQLNQMDALRFAIEHYRTSVYCKGTLIWQFNDCWPSQSWAVQDYAHEYKLAGRELRRLYAPVLIAAKVEGGSCRVYVVNDSPGPIQDTLVVEAVSLRDGAVQEVHRQAFEQRASSRKMLQEVDTSVWDTRLFALRARLESGMAMDRLILLAEPKEIASLDLLLSHIPPAPPEV